MNTKTDYKKEWATLKNGLNQFTHDASLTIKKWEDEVVKFSKKGKIHLDKGALNLKKEHLYYLIGKEYIKNEALEQTSGHLKKLVSEFKKAEAAETQLTNKLKKIK